MSEHTKLPWKWRKDEDEAIVSLVREINCAPVFVIASNRDHWLAITDDDADFILQACNNYEATVAQRDALLAACEKVLKWQTMTKDENLMLFREETGIWPPGKSAPIGISVDEDHVEKYIEWIEATAASIREEIEAAIAAGGGK